MVTMTDRGPMVGIGVDNVTLITWGSHGDLAISPDSRKMYQLGYDLQMQNEASPNWHSLLLIDSNSPTQATRIGQVSEEHGLIWGLTFDDEGNLFGITSESFMIEIDTTSGAILWHAQIVDLGGNPVSMWDMASYPHLLALEPSIPMFLLSALGITMNRRRR